MVPRPVSFPAPESGFAAIAAMMAGQPLHELCPSGPGAEAAALGFGLGLAASWDGPLFWAGEEGVFAEEGAPYPPGLAQFGLDLSRLTVIRAAKRDEAFWATEEALTASGAVVICALSAQRKPLDLRITRRLLLLAERNHSRCLLVRPLAETSAAWTRWRISPAQSNADPHELGAPAYALELMRNRAGPAGARYVTQWNAHARCFDNLACDRSAASEHGSVDPIRSRA